MKLELPSITDLFIAAALLVVGLLLYWQVRDGRDAREQFQKTVAVQTTLITQAQEQTKQIQAAINSRDTAAQASIAALQSQIAHLQTPSEIAPWLEATLNKSVPAPISVTVPASGNGPVEAQIPQADLQAVRDLVSHAQQNQVALASCTQDKADLGKEVDAQKAQTKSAQVERDAAIKQAKGGSFWTRTKKSLKYVGIGVAIGALIGAHAL